MTMSFFDTDRLTAGDAVARAQHIAFAPIVFQASRALRQRGILAFVHAEGGATMEEIARGTGLSTYGARVLLEAGLGIGLVTCRAGMYRLTKTGWFILNDPMTIANMDFAHDVCYEGMARLDEAITDGSPTGLAVFGEWDTIYQALPHLPPAAARSWFAFDHFYSDDAYPVVVPLVMARAPRSILDIGGNTGKFALQCLRYDPDVEIGLADLAPMARAASVQIEEHGYAHRVRFHPVDMLDEAQCLPTGYDAVWMSQFLDCFSEDEIVAILTKVRATLSDHTPVFIMEPFWDRQRLEVSAFCLQMTSLYFTSMANGNSQMYNSSVFMRLIERAGLTVTEQIDNIGVCQSLLVCHQANHGQSANR
jgi:hypothetical protein